jgi:hypothetical protein
MRPIPEHLREHGEALQPDDQPSRAVLWIAGALGVLCVVSLVMAGVIVTGGNQ